jgi:hypothetical protein
MKTITSLVGFCLLAIASSSWASTISSASDPALSDATLIDFNGAYNNLMPIQTALQSPISTSDFAQLRRLSANSFDAEIFQRITFDFDTPMSIFALNLDLGSITPWELSVFDSANNLIEKTSTSISTFYGISDDSGKGISRASLQGIFTDQNQDRYAHIDNIYFKAPSTVPVPAAIWLFGSTLVGFLGLKRRQSA